MQRSIFAAVSGLRNHQTRMDVIGNNIANVNTTAFKSGRVTFKDSFYQAIHGATRPTDGQGGTNAFAVGLGMQIGSMDTVFTQGNLETTGVTTDMAVQGNDFFVVAKGGQQFYTRAGNFQVDSAGRLVSATDGAVVQGRTATAGVLGSGVGDISIPAGVTTAAKATTKMTFGGNLDTSAPVIIAVDPANPTAAELADPANAGSIVQSTRSVYDSVGVRHDLTIVAWKSSANTWGYKIDPSSAGYDATKPYSFGPGSQSSPAGAATPWQFTFNADGTIDSKASSVPTISFTPTGTGSPLSITLDPGTGATGLTSYAGLSSAVLRDQDGYAAGKLESISVQRDGTITGSFSNGTNETLAQVALASFNNPGGLDRAGDNLYVTSPNSGSATIGFSGRESSSTITSGALEMSNVDLAQEFTNMIITERGFQANGKMITTSDEMLQELVNLRR